MSILSKHPFGKKWIATTPSWNFPLPLTLISSKITPFGNTRNVFRLSASTLRSSLFFVILFSRLFFSILKKSTCFDLVAAALPRASAIADIISRVASRRSSLDRIRCVPNEKIPRKIPRMARTTRSSSRVKPLTLLILGFPVGYVRILTFPSLFAVSSVRPQVKVFVVNARR